MVFRPCTVGPTVFPTLPEGTATCDLLQKRFRAEQKMPKPPLDDLATGGLSQILNRESDPCQISQRWRVTLSLARKLIAVGVATPFPVSIISGFRTVESQNLLRRKGRPTAANDRSTHLTCPATGADLRIGAAVTRVTQAVLGNEIFRAGLRWGGGSPVDPETGIPSDWNHADEGPR